MDSGEHRVIGSEVFVGGLPHAITDDKIHEVFSTCGEIKEIRLINQKGDSKVFGFVCFVTKEAAAKAIKDLDGFVLEGKKIGVLPSANQDTLFLGNLYKGWNASELEEIVREVFSDVVSVDLVMAFGNGEETPGQQKKNRGFAFVKFSSHAAAARAYKLGSKSDFVLSGNLHPAVQWAEVEPIIDDKKLAKIKILFVKNLPANSDENYLKKMFEPFGKLEKVVLPRKGQSSVGFVHFSKRPDLENALTEMNEKIVQGPKGGPSFKLQVEVARPMDKKRKRVLDKPDSEPSKILNQVKPLKDEPTNLLVGQASKIQKEPASDDLYEAAVVSLPVVVKERLLRILRLGIATRFDMDLQCLTSLRELPQSSAISILDQFMLSGADMHDKGAYLAGLISRHQNDRLEHTQHSSNLSRVEGILAKEGELPVLPGRIHLPPIKSLATNVDATAARSYSYLDRYSFAFPDYAMSSQPTFARMEMASMHLHPAASSAPYNRFKLDSQPTRVVDHQSSRPQIRFDPFTGEPYKFDPFTGEPIRPGNLPRQSIRPGSSPRQFGSPY